MPDRSRMSVRRPQGRQRSVVQQRGFTLLELLIAMSLMALLMLGMVSTLFTIAQTQSRVDQRLFLLDRQRVMVHFLRDLWGNVSPMKNATASMAHDGKMPNYFKGESSSVQWMGVMPARFGAGGRSHFRLETQPNTDQTGNHLVLRFKPWESSKKTIDFSDATAYVIEPDVQIFELRYQRLNKGLLEWHSKWTFADEIPSAIEIRIQGATASWPKTVVEVLSTASFIKGAAGGPVFGGTSQ